MRDINDYTKKYIKSNFENNYQVKYRKKKVLEEINKYEHNSILEIGCGLNSLAENVDDYQFFTVVEPSEIFINNARYSLEQQSTLKSDKVEFYKGLFPEEVIDDISEKKYDFIICSGLLHEMEEPEKILDGILVVSDNKTVIHINVPNAYSLHRLLAYEAGIIENIEAFSERNISYQQYSVFSLESLIMLLNNWANNQNLSIELLNHGSYFVKPFSHSQMERMIKANIIDAKIINGFDRLIKYMPNFGSEIFVNFRIKKNQYMGK